MRILHVVPSYKPAFIYGGTITAISILCESQAALEHDIQVFTTTANGAAELEVIPGEVVEVDGVAVRYFKRWTKDHSHFSPALLHQLWKQAKQFDAIHLHSWWNLVTMPAVFVCWLRGVKPLFSPHGMLSEYSFGQRKKGLKEIFHRIVGRFLLRNTILHATTQQEVEEGTQMIPDWEYKVVSNIVELPAHKNHRKVPINPVFQIVFLSRIDYKKGIHLLLDALSQVSFPFQLQLAGKGVEAYELELRQQIVALELEEKVNWLGWMSGEAKYELLAQADLFALTSYNENFAIVVVEALAMGTAVLVSNKVGLSNYVLANGFGWKTNLSVEAIVAHLEAAYQAQQKRTTIRHTAPEKVYVDFSSSTIAKQYIAVYENI